MKVFLVTFLVLVVAGLTQGIIVCLPGHCLSIYAGAGEVSSDDTSNSEERKILIDLYRGGRPPLAYFRAWPNADVQETVEELTLNLLQDVDLLCIYGYSGWSFHEDEIEAVRQFVNNGGNLFIQMLGWALHAYNGIPPEDNPLNVLCEPFGMWFNGDYARGERELEDIPRDWNSSKYLKYSHASMPLPELLPSVDWFITWGTPSSITVTPPAFSLVNFQTDGALVAAAEYGKGRVVAMQPSGFYRDDLWKENGAESPDNAQLMDDVLRWFGDIMDSSTYSSVVYIEMNQAVRKGDSFLCRARVENITDVAGFSFDVVFDPAVLEAVEVKEGSFLSNSVGTYWSEPDINNTAGVIAGIVSAGMGSGSIGGDGTLAIITFKAIGSGETYIRLQDVKMSSPDAEPIPITVLSASITVAAYLAWDVNKDGEVDILDIVLVGQHFGQAIATPLDPNPDVNGDGEVDIFDVVAVCQHFGEVYSTAAPSRDIWNISRQHLPLLTDIYFIIEGNRNPEFLTARRVLQRLIFNVRVREVEAFQNFPNPFNPDTWIPYQLREDSRVTIRIYSVVGDLVRELALGYMPAGLYVSSDRAAHWDGRNASYERVASGVYFYTIQAGDYSATRKMTVAK